MEAPLETVRSTEDFVRALRFPVATPGEIALCISGALAFFLLIWLIADLTERRRRRQALPAALEPPELLETPDRRRADFRVPMSKEIEIHPEGTPWLLPGKLTELSAGGGSFRTERPPPSSGVLRIRFPEQPGLGALDAEVVRKESHPARHRHYLHFRFLGPSRAQYQSLLRWVTSRRHQIFRPD